MKLKEVILASLLIAFLIGQNYLLFSLPITLTYITFYLIAKNINNKGLICLSILAFVVIKNIIYMALPFTILFDIIGLFIVVTTFFIKNNLIRYVLIVLAIIIHILLLDFSTALITGSVFISFKLNIISGFITYIYAPLSIVLIVSVDGIDYLTKEE